MIKVTALKAMTNSRLWIRFSDGMAGEHDFGPMLGETGSMIAPLREPAYFARVFIEMGAPTWPNGFDISPEWLYRRMKAGRELARDMDAA